MNIYFLVEGKRTEMKVYPKWLSYLVPELQRSTSFDTVVKNNYFMFSGNGFPSLLDNHLRNCVIDINNAGNYDYFVICLDADEQSVEDCRQEILEFMKKENINLNSKTKFKIIVQNKCLETWFLANPKIFKKNPNSNFLKECIEFYNVKKDDPELMGKLPDFESSTSVFHSSYLQELLAERNVNYSKKNPQSVAEEYFLRELILRNQKTNHIQSFQNFIQFCQEIRIKIVQ
ncbi:hypothetical protein [Hugenholtzia roseola]|uniref:hypothetical protein n=1 Tax=Hugenholtzia roseola TaxID=1002 RepID=UPI0004789FE0|nr:hypothetical protein [Hugenholtzia roseola]